MASQDQSERCKLLSIIRNSTSRRRNRPEAKSNSQMLKCSNHSSDGGYHSPLKTNSACTPTSSTGIVHKLARLSQLEIPDTPKSTQLLRHPTVLRAGPPMTKGMLRNPIDDERQELFMTPRYSILPRTAALSSLVRDMPYLSLDQAVSPLTLVVPAVPNTREHPRESKNDDDKGNPKIELQILHNAINILYDSSCLLIPPYLFDRLNQLEVVDNKHDFTFQEYRSEQFTTTMEKLDRVRQFLPVMKQVIDLVSATLVKERNNSAREA